MKHWWKFAFLRSDVEGLLIISLYFFAMQVVQLTAENEALKQQLVKSEAAKEALEQLLEESEQRLERERAARAASVRPLTNSPLLFGVLWGLLCCLQ